MQSSPNTGSAAGCGFDLNLSTSINLVKPTIVNHNIATTNCQTSRVMHRFSGESSYSLFADTKIAMGRRAKLISSTMDIFDDSKADITGQVQESKEMHETLLRFAEKKTATGRRSKLMSSTVDIFDENKANTTGHDQGPKEAHESSVLADSTPNEACAGTTNLTSNAQEATRVTKLGRLADSTHQSSSDHHTTVVKSDFMEELDKIGDRLRQMTIDTTLLDHSLALKPKPNLAVEGAHCGNKRLSKKTSVNVQQGRFQSSDQSINRFSQTAPAAGRRAPLRLRTHPLQVRASFFDIPGKGPGKENKPPGFDVEDTGKKGGKPGSTFELDQTSLENWLGVSISC